MPDPARSQLAELKIPAQSEFVGLAKRVATSLGGQLGFSLDEIDELGIAVAQACGSALETAEETWGSGATLMLSFAAIERGIAVEVDTIAPRSEEALPVRRQAPARGRTAEMEMQRALAREMIRLFVDDFRHQVDTGGRQIRYRMVKYLIS
jgi:serine/threonine-protein kinase RsbW